MTLETLESNKETVTENKDNIKLLFAANELQFEENKDKTTISTTTI